MGRTQRPGIVQSPFDRAVTGAIETAAAIGTNLFGSAPAGIEGIFRLARTGSPLEAAQRVGEVQQALTYQPRTQEGQSMLRGVGEVLSPLSAPSEFVGETTMETFGSPAMATAAEVLGDPLNFVPGLKGAAIAAPAAARGIRAYHGSPFSFDRFSKEQIGTGEGAQAYGYGLYFAELEDVAKGYRDALTRPRLNLRGREIDSIWTEDIRSKFADIYEDAKNEPGISAHRRATLSKVERAGGDVEAAARDYDDLLNEMWDYNGSDSKIEELEARFSPFGDYGVEFSNRDYDAMSGSRDSLDQLLGELSQVDNPNQIQNIIGQNPNAPLVRAYERYVKPELDFVKNPGSMYEVNIKTTRDRLLNWDKPFTEQSEYVQKILRDEGVIDRVLKRRNEARDRYRERTGEERPPYTEADITGKDLYFAAGDIDMPFGPDANPVAETSNRLQELGIDGILYADGLSRKKDGGTSNFVVFDDRIIEISKRYGVALPIAGMIMAGTITPEEAQSMSQDAI